MARSNIILVGFMGTGKSATANIVARRMERTFVDMDRMIEERAGRKISQIFSTDGESTFRTLESALVQELAARRHLVIAAGGGVVINPENIVHFNDTGVVICLTASPSAILGRINGTNHRPLLENGNKTQCIMDLLEKRRAMYDAIPYHVDTTYLTPDVAADRVIDLYEDAVGSMDPR